jgi:hypothetical protein
MMSSESSPALFSEYFFNPWAVPYFIAALVSLAILLILIYKAAKDPVVYLFIGVQISLAIDLTAAVLATCVEEGHSGIWTSWMVINNFFGILGATFYVHFSYAYLNEKNLLPDKKVLLLYIAPLVAGIVMFAFHYPEVHSTDRAEYGLYTVGSEGLAIPALMIFFLILGALVFAATINFVKMFRSTDIELKRLSGYFILATLVFLVALTTTALLRFLSPDMILPFDLAILSTAIYNLIIAYGMLKKDLFDINEILRTQIIPYVLTNFVIAWALVLSEETLNHLLAESLEVTKAISTIFIVLIFAPIHDLSHRLAKRLLPRDGLAKGHE